VNGQRVCKVCLFLIKKTGPGTVITPNNFTGAACFDDHAMKKEILKFIKKGTGK